MKIRFKYLTRIFAMISCILILWPNVYILPVKAESTYNIAAQIASSGFNNQLDYAKLTHIYVQGLLVTSSSNPTLKGYTPSIMASIRAGAKAANPNIKVLIYLQSLIWGTPSNPSDLTAIMANSSLRHQLVANLVNFVITYDFDGINIDWEGTDVVKSNYDAFLSELHASLPSDKLIGVDGDGDPIGFDWFSVSSVNNYVDFVNVMAYGYSLPAYSEYSDVTYYTQKWVNIGVPKNKLNVGIWMAGADKVNVNLSGWGQIVEQLNPADSDTRASATIIDGLSGNGLNVSGGVLWFGGISLARQKVNWVKNNGYAGVMLGILDWDDFTHGKNMLSSVYNEFALNMAPGITTTSQGNGTVGVAYSQTLAVSGGTSPYRWSLINGSLPGGLTLSSTGIIAGIPTTSGTSSFTIMVTDNTGSKATKALSIIVNTTPVINTSSLANGAVGKSYSQTLAASGGTSPYNWSLNNGSLPGGLTLSSSGIIAGIPAAAGTSGFTVMVTDNYGSKATKTFSLIVNRAPEINTSFLSNGSVGIAYSQTLAASNGISPYSWSLSKGSLPGGLTLSSTGIIAGIPTTSGISSFTVMVTDNTGSKGKKNLSLIVNRAPGINTASLINGAVGKAYSQTLTASGGTSPYNWSLIKGSLPGGLTLSSTGIITGIPTAAGTSSFTVMVTDNRGSKAAKTLSIIINTAPVINTAPLINGAVGTAYSQTLTASGGISPYNWSLIKGSLPGGLTLSSTGIITGIPTAAGTSSFTVMVTDNRGSKAAKTLSIIMVTSQQVCDVNVVGLIKFIDAVSIGPPGLIQVIQDG